MAEGDRFRQACGFAVRVWPVDPQRVAARRARLRVRRQAVEERLRVTEREEALAAPTDAPSRSRRLSKLRRESDRLARALDRPDFHRAIELTRLDVTFDQVLRLAAFASIVSVIAAVFSLAMAAVLRAPRLVLVAVAAAAIVGPIGTYAAFASYPEMLARRLRAASLAAAPEAVNYMAMSMRVVPALDRAVAFAAHHTEEPLASRLRGLIWTVYLRDSPGVETAFFQFAREWGPEEDDVKRAFLALGSAALERTDAGLERVLEKSRRIAFDGTKARIREYAAALRGPTTVLFALGILLPLIIGSMLPLLAIGGIAPSLAATEHPTLGPDFGVHTAVVMDVLFPLGAFAYAHRILAGRPGAGAEMGKTAPRPRWLTVLAVSLLLTSAAGLVLAGGPVAMLLPLWILVAAGVVWFLPGVRGIESRRRSVRAIETEFPDALFILGSRIAEGSSAEHAVTLTADATRGTETANFLARVVRRIQMSRAGLEAVLFEPTGVLADLPSRMVRAAFRMVVEVSRKDPVTAGKTIVDTSTYLRDLQEVDREIRRDLSATVDAMESTANLFAPIVLGVTCALYGLLARAFSPLIVLGLSPASFLGIVGLYLFLAVAVITYFRVGVACGRDAIEVRRQLVRTWPVSMAVFTAAFFVAQLGLSG